MQAFSTVANSGRFSKKFYEQLDSYVEKTKFKTSEKTK